MYIRYTCQLIHDVVHFSKDDHRRGVPVSVTNHRRRSVDCRNGDVVGRRVVFKLGPVVKSERHIGKNYSSGNIGKLVKAQDIIHLNNVYKIVFIMFSIHIA